MNICYFKTGNIVLRVETPDPLDIKEPYSLFLCEQEKTDVNVIFRYGDIAEPSGMLLAETDSVDVFEDDGAFYFFYHITGEKVYYALRKVNKEKPSHHEIIIPHEYEGKIWTRLVFSLINFDDIAAMMNASVFHASFIEYNGSAILFTAPCGTGKSTQAALWEKHQGAEIINGDKVLIYEDNGSFFAAGLPFSGSSDICKNLNLPVKAIVRLSQAKENTVTRLTGINAYKAVFEGCYHSKWSADFNKITSDVAVSFAGNVPVYHLACLPDENATQVLKNELFE